MSGVSSFYTVSVSDFGFRVREYDVRPFCLQISLKIAWNSTV